MKKLFLVLLLSFVFIGKMYAQDFKYAWIIDPQIGKNEADSSLLQIIDNINKNKELSFVVISGNITMHGLNSELESAKNLFDKIKLPFYVIPGESDLRWSESAGLRFPATFRNNHFFFNFNNTQQIGLNSAIVWRGGAGHFSPEEINWLSDTLSTQNKSKELFLYSYFPFNQKLDNWTMVTNLLTEYKFVFLLNSVGKEKSIQEENGFFSISGVRSSSAKVPAYNIVENKSDSILFYQNSNDVAILWGGIKKSAVKFVKVKPNTFYNYKSDERKNSPALLDSVLWQIDLNQTSLSDLLTDGNKIFATTFRGNVYCFDLNGKKKWEYDSKEKIAGNPVIEKNTIVFGTLQGDLISLNAETGEVIQTIGIAEPLTSKLIKTSIEYNGSPTTAVIVGTANGNLFCYDINSFELIWENNSAAGLIRTKPLDIDHRLFYGSQDGFLYSVDDRTGTLYWKWKDKNDFFTSPVVCPPVSDGKYIYISTPDKFISKIDMLLGVSKWRNNDYSSWESIGITNDNKYLLVRSISNNFYFVNTSNGRKYKEIKMDYGFDLNPNIPIEWKGNFIFGSEKGTVYVVDKHYNWKPLFFMGNARLNSIQHLTGNKFVASNIDGKLVCFELK